MKRLLKKVYISGLSTFLFLQTKLVSFAIDIPLPDNPTQDADLIAFVHRLINLAVGMAGLIAVVLLVYNGIQYILSSGDEGKVEKATKGIIYAIIGLTICFLAVLIVRFVINNVIRIV